MIPVRSVIFQRLPCTQLSKVLFASQSCGNRVLVPRVSKCMYDVRHDMQITETRYLAINHLYLVCVVFTFPKK